MDKHYSHEDNEQSIYKMWDESGGFSPKDGAEPFTMIMPPPNANDPLHVGHAMFASIEDILTRYQRMNGKAALWLPGTDHAGIETQFVFEKKLKKEGKSRFDFDRETLYKKIWDYVQKNSDIAVNQLKRIGASADWGRFTFMLDDEVVEMVIDTFRQMHEEGLVYRDMRLINYCPKCGTGYSDLEVLREERQSPMYYMKYGPFTIATARPETKFRDTALAVNPTDPRYKDEIGKTHQIIGLLGEINMKVIADKEVDPEFGTGIMKVTPAHDPHDFELGQKYDLPVTPIIDFEGRMDFSWFIDDADEKTDPKYLARAKKYHRKKVLIARDLMLKDLKKDGLLVKTDEKHINSLGLCYRCKTILEPLPLPQFFIKVKSLTEKALASLDKKEVVVYGAGHDKILRHWLKNLKDWNVSRQIVWGIRMPVWYDSSKISEMVVHFISNQDEKVFGILSELLEKYSLDEIREGLQTLQAPVGAEYVISKTSPGEKYVQETDTFDTWFSSAQWPMTTLKASRVKDDFERFYPTQVMETGYDILPFWVMRMLMMGLYKTGKAPFESVYLHGLVRDEKGQKMSKSKGNVINPLDLVEKYGADALRMALVMSTTAGKDSSTGENKIRGMRNFTNKIWNASRFVMMHLKDQAGSLSDELEGDEAFSKKLNEVVVEVSEHIDAFRFGLAAEVVYNEFWHWYCDECIEKSKKGELSSSLLLEGLVVFLKLLHPFVPFVTEKIYQLMKQDGLIENDVSLLMMADWPLKVKNKKNN